MSEHRNSRETELQDERRPGAKWGVRPETGFTRLTKIVGSVESIRMPDYGISHAGDDETAFSPTGTLHDFGPFKSVTGIRGLPLVPPPTEN